MHVAAVPLTDRCAGLAFTGETGVLLLSTTQLTEHAVATLSDLFAAAEVTASTAPDHRSVAALAQLLADCRDAGVSDRDRAWLGQLLAPFTVSYARSGDVPQDKRRRSGKAIARCFRTTVAGTAVVAGALWASLVVRGGGVQVTSPDALRGLYMAPVAVGVSRALERRA